jgi:hypothetical protein
VGGQGQQVKGIGQMMDQTGEKRLMRAAVIGLKDKDVHACPLLITVVS